MNRKMTPSELKTEFTNSAMAVKMRQQYVKKTCGKGARPSLAGAWVVDDRQYMCDGYSVAVFRDIIPGLPEPPTLERVDVQGKVIDDARSKARKIDVKCINYKSLQKTRQMIKRDTHCHESYIIAKIGGWYYSAYYILWLQMLTGRLTFSQDTRGYLIVDGVNGTMVLLPVRYNREMVGFNIVANYNVEGDVI